MFCKPEQVLLVYSLIPFACPLGNSNLSSSILKFMATFSNCKYGPARIEFITFVDRTVSWGNIGNRYFRQVTGSSSKVIYYWAYLLLPYEF